MQYITVDQQVLSELFVYYNFALSLYQLIMF